MKSLRPLGLLLVLFTILASTSVFAAQRVVLVENFTNVGCVPCASANPITAQFMNAYPDQIVLNVQYHVNWPSATDPFYLANTADVNGRRSFYGVNAVPDMFTDGVDGPSPGSYSGLEAAVTSQLAVDAPLTLTINTSQTGQDLTVDVDVLAETDLPAGLKLRMAIVEPHIYLDPPGADNGERNFYSTMRQMLPGYAGTTFTIGNGELLSFQETTTLDATWVDPYVVVWVQNDATKEVLQAGSSAPVPDYEHYFGHPAPKAVGPMLQTTAFHADIMNLGTMGDIYDLAISYDHPAAWGASVCIGPNCLAPGTTSVTVPVSAGQMQDLSVDITPILDKGEGSITLTVTSQGDPTHSWSETFSVIASGTPVLIVDDDAGASYETYYKNAVEANGYVNGMWDRDGDGKLSTEILSNFYAVVWNVGWGFPSLDADDRAAIGGYLDGGGSLFITGQDIGWDFHDVSGSQYGNQAWYRTYLGATYVSDDTNDLTIDGLAGDPISDGVSIVISGGTGASNQQYPSEIAPYGAGVGCLFYSAGREAGVHQDTGTFKSVYFSFGFEGIASDANRTLLMGNVLSWLGADAAPVDDSPSSRPFLASNPVASPNPFNPATEIRFEVGGSKSAQVKIDVYDIAGRKVRSLFEGAVQPGPQRFDWNGRNDAGANAASGLYLGRVVVDGQTRNVKMTLAK